MILTTCRKSSSVHTESRLVIIALPTAKKEISGPSLGCPLDSICFSFRFSFFLIICYYNSNLFNISEDTRGCSQPPVVFTHSNARALADTTRNKPDHQIRAMAAKQGVQGYLELLKQKEITSQDETLNLKQAQTMGYAQIVKHHL
jgi:hypothetical protein